MFFSCPSVFFLLSFCAFLLSFCVFPHSVLYLPRILSCAILLFPEFSLMSPPFLLMSDCFFSMPYAIVVSAFFLKKRSLGGVRMVILRGKMMTFRGQNDYSPAQISEKAAQSSDCEASKRAVSGHTTWGASTSLNSQKSCMTTSPCKSWNSARGCLV